MNLSENVPCKVVLIMDSQFGNAIEDIVKLIPVWVIDSPVNRMAVEHIRKCHPKHYSLSLLLNFPGEDIVETFIRALNAIEDHHGSYSQMRAYDMLQVIGLSLNSAISTVLKNYGFSQVTVETKGFIAKKKK